MTLKQKIRDFLMDYGALPTIYALEEYSSDEEFEKAMVIKEVIDEYNKSHDHDIPTKYDEALQYFLEDYNDFTIGKIPEYAKKLKQRLDK